MTLLGTTTAPQIRPFAGKLPTFPCLPLYTDIGILMDASAILMRVGERDSRRPQPLLHPRHTRVCLGWIATVETLADYNHRSSGSLRKMHWHDCTPFRFPSASHRPFPPVLLSLLALSAVSEVVGVACCARFTRSQYPHNRSIPGPSARYPNAMRAHTPPSPPAP